MKQITGGVTSAKGFSAASCAAHIKYRDRKDMALIFSAAPCAVGGAFTSNVVKASPVVWDRNLVDSGAMVRAVVVNSGIANACTGKEGDEICRRTAEKAAAVLRILPEEVLLGSTGVIGMQIPMDRVAEGIDCMAVGLSDSAEAGTEAEKAIMTTDTVPKETCWTFELSDGTEVTLGGMSKGSGMIHPNMCTMLCYLTTDMAISSVLLNKAVKKIADLTFNMISVDGDTSTNDTFLCMANGMAGNRIINEEDDPDYVLFCEALFNAARTLARKMAADGEGASKLIETHVVNMDTEPHARILAKSVICSSLTKAAVFGRDANWGRILCALGYAGVNFDPRRVDLWFLGEGESAEERKKNGLLIYTEGSQGNYSEEAATALLSGEEVDILCDMHMGDAEATAWGCDLTYDYVKINADYRS